MVVLILPSLIPCYNSSLFLSSDRPKIVPIHLLVRLHDLYFACSLCSRKSLGLPLEEPGRYVDASFFGKDQYDPESPLYRYDYWGEPKNSEKSKQERMTEIHNKSIVGKGTVWYEMTYEDCIKQQMQREAQPKEREEEAEDEETQQSTEEDDDDDDDDDFDFSILSNLGSNFSDQLHVNGTESSRMSDEGIFED